MAHRLFLSFKHSRPGRRRFKFDRYTLYRIPWIESPLDKSDTPPRLYKQADATPIELFFDLFFVANLSTFTASNDINSLEALWSYVCFLGIIWFTWLQVTLFDIRFARDSVFERICKAVQLATMVGFASAGSGFAMQVLPENLWIFHSLTILLAISRLMLSLEYFIASVYLPPNMAFNLRCVTLFMFVNGLIYIALYFLFNDQAASIGSYIWTLWWFQFAAETFVVMVKADQLPGIGFEDTHLNVRMGLLTLIIIGDGIISVTRIVNRTVGNGWTRWSFVHIFGVTISVYLLWQSYFDITPTEKLGKLRQKIWTCLHFPFHAILILLSEGMQILALTLDVSLKLKQLRDTILSACSVTRPSISDAIDSLNSTIADMGIDFTYGALVEKYAIQGVLWDLRRQPRLCPSETETGSLDIERSHDIMGNVTVALFSSMGITPPEGHTKATRSDHLLAMYLRMLGFVFLYYFVVAALAMFMFAAFTFLVHHDPTRRVFRLCATGTRVLAGFSLLSIIALVTNFDLAYRYMTNPMILFTVALALLICLLGDQVWHTLAFYYAGFEVEDGEGIELDDVHTNA
ncbi:hypothetical protein MGYG_05037 [Nannizzia gypsea CBS 118893]|uniref:Low temperature requirement A n=1 Tax=Arthroderma gypseum (strain ATCC MYA-4604 / CBS 118893) TaxID=535722 RepID=E4UY72_ARTGP|nr:hypothetical protein MGYG_05037 [Nannizzia gypsea CBS 118893]EFR02035.1 hypothetical protein MGYG_05037 [Nannizzia gypsea CBS 118893]